MKKTIYLLLIIIAALIVALIFTNRAVAPNENDEPIVDEGAESTVTIFLAADPESDPEDLPYGTQEVAGCGPEYLVPLIESYEGEDNLENALNYLFAIDVNEYKGYRNSFYMSDLTVDVNEVSNPIIVDLQGELIQAGTCDDPRLKAQVEKTVEYYLENSEYEIQLNGSEQGWRCLGDESGLCV